tara:strand:- start:885 stop:1769 length:885 start_codon:yes stop_codon:yes gene_type:complete
MKFISFFAGIGGIDLGLERAGHRCVGQCETDPYALAVLTKHWPDVPRFGDIKEIDPDDLPEADLWAGGFPCQDISNAGKRVGIRGERSGLFFDFMRLAAEVRPRYILMENVSALINRGLSEVLGTLAESGYDAEWDCLPAIAFGAPHQRERVFIIAYPYQRGEAVIPTGQRTEGEREVNAFRTRKTSSLRNLGDSERGGFQSGIFQRGKPRPEITPSRCCTTLGTYLGETWEAEPDETWLDDGLPSRDAEIYSRLYGNAVVPHVAEYIGRLLTSIEPSPVANCQLPATEGSKHA